MRSGDAYKIARMAKMGVSREDIVHSFRYKYPPEEISRFIPKRRGRPKKVKDDVGSTNM